MIIVTNYIEGSYKTYSDLEGSRDIRVLKIASEVPSITPTAIIAG
jgi:hypothetical protein